MGVGSEVRDQVLQTLDLLQVAYEQEVGARPAFGLGFGFGLGLGLGLGLGISEVGQEVGHHQKLALEAELAMLGGAERARRDQCVEVARLAFE